MKRANLNSIIDMIAFSGFVLLTTTGILMRYVLPPGSGRYSSIWGLNRHSWGEIHFWISVFFFSVLAVHLLLHWRWIVSTLTGQPKQGSGLRAGLGVIGLITVIALSISPFLAPVETTINEPLPTAKNRHRSTGYPITGSMTLNDVEKLTGVPAGYLIDGLKLPKATSHDARLGRLLKDNDYDMKDLHFLIENYKANN